MTKTEWEHNSISNQIKNKHYVYRNIKHKETYNKQKAS